jgi:hypothetical protein
VGEIEYFESKLSSIVKPTRVHPHRRCTTRHINALALYFFLRICVASPLPKRSADTMYRSPAWEGSSREMYCVTFLFWRIFSITRRTEGNVTMSPEVDMISAISFLSVLASTVPSSSEKRMFTLSLPLAVHDWCSLCLASMSGNVWLRRVDRGGAMVENRTWGEGVQRRNYREREGERGERINNMSRLCHT